VKGAKSVKGKREESVKGVKSVKGAKSKKAALRESRRTVDQMKEEDGENPMRSSQ